MGVGQMSANDPRRTKSGLVVRSPLIFDRLINALLRTPAWRAGCWSAAVLAASVYLLGLAIGAYDSQVVSGWALGLMIAVLYSGPAGGDD